MNTVELIKKKRDGKILNDDEINYLISNYTKGKIPDYQFSALLMAVLLKGMNKTETASLTESMLNSGKTINLSALKGNKIDKHSTGGVGDKTSLIIAPIVASTGVNVPMISGRGLGHTGGTLDKLDSLQQLQQTSVIPVVDDSANGQIGHDLHVLHRHPRSASAAGEHPFPRWHTDWISVATDKAPCWLARMRKVDVIRPGTRRVQTSSSTTRMISIRRPPPASDR